jgi:cytoskeleton protein RodZ
VIVPALPVPTPVPVQVPTPAPPPAAAPPADQPRITLRARAEIWTQVRDTRANQTLISRNMRPGETFVVPNREGLLLSVGNAAMIEVLVDGQPSPAFGNTPGVRRDVPLVPDQLRPRPAAGTQAPAAPAAAPPAPARLNPPAQRQ